MVVIKTDPKKSVCPHCGEILDAHSTRTKDVSVPKPGDLSMCIHCASALEFDNNLALIRLRAETLDEMTFTDREDMYRLQASIRALNVNKLKDDHADRTR